MCSRDEGDCVIRQSAAYENSNFEFELELEAELPCCALVQPERDTQKILAVKT